MITNAARLTPLRTSPFYLQKRKIRPYTPPKFKAANRDEFIANWIEENLQREVVKVDLIGSSSWSSQYAYMTRDEEYNKINYFVKTAPASEIDMFRAEAKGLDALASRIPSFIQSRPIATETEAVVVPQVRHVGLAPSGFSFLISDYLNMRSGTSGEQLGKSIAMMHLAEPSDEEAKKGKFGFPVDNTIGGTSQPNGWMDNWVDFFRERRLRHQLKLAGDPNLSRMGEELCDNLHLFFKGILISDHSIRVAPGIEVKPSVLHGDLWSGNYAAVDGRPAIFDPATYYGHHEAEFGMSWCASFGPAFWNAYHDLIPKAPGFEERHLIYTLYHYLNHYNLFGSGYYSQCSSILTRLTKEIIRS